MPEIRRQKPPAKVTSSGAKTTPTRTQTSRSNGSLLDRIAPVSQVDSGGLHVSLYGKSKTGKTRFISTFPKKVLIIGAEDGTRSIRTVEGVSFVRLILNGSKEPEDGNFIYLEQYGELIDQLHGSEEYLTVAVDTASALQDLILCDILGLQELPAQRSWGMATREQYGECALRTKEMLRKLLSLKQNVVITAHERNFNEEVSSELLIPSIGSALSPSVTNWLNGAVEYICQTFIREATEDVKTTLGTGSKQKTIVTKKKSGKFDYCLRVGPHAVFMTGFRLPPGFELPDFIVNPDYEQVAALVRGGE